MERGVTSKETALSDHIVAHQDQDQDLVHILAEVLQEEEEDVIMERIEERKESIEDQDQVLGVVQDLIQIRERAEVEARMPRADLFLKVKRVTAEEDLTLLSHMIRKEENLMKK